MENCNTYLQYGRGGRVHQAASSVCDAVKKHSNNQSPPGFGAPLAWGETTGPWYLVNFDSCHRGESKKSGKNSREKKRKQKKENSKQSKRKRWPLYWLKSTWSLTHKPHIPNNITVHVLYINLQIQTFISANLHILCCSWWEYIMDTLALSVCFSRLSICIILKKWEVFLFLEQLRKVWNFHADIGLYK